MNNSRKPGQRPSRKTTARKTSTTSPYKPDQSTTSQKKTSSKKTRHKKAGQRRTDRKAPTVIEFDGSERLQKVMAAAGLGSRRALEKRIEAGQVEVNGQAATLGATVKPDDQVRFEGREYRVTAAQPAHKTLIYHKPEGEVTTRDDPEGRRTVFDRLPKLKEGRWIAIGRLDLNTAGLLLLTTDGELANRMMHPSGQVDREYLCRIRGAITEEQIEKLLKGVQLDDGMASFSDLVPGEVTAGHAWYTVTILEGRNREVRRLWEAVGAQVARLKRVRFGPVFLPARVRTGRYEELGPNDHRILREDVGLPAQMQQLELSEVRGGTPRTTSRRS